MISYVISLTLLTSAVIVLRTVFKNKMASRLVYALWLAVLIRMVLPFDIIQIDRVGVDYIGAIESAAGHEIVLMSDDKTENSNLQAETELEVNSPVEDKTPVSDKEPILNSGNVGGSENLEQNIDSIQSENNFISDVITDKVETGIGSVIDSSSFVESQEINKDPVEADSAEKPSYETPSATQNEVLEKPLTETPTQDIPNETNEHITVSVKDILNAVWIAGALITASVFVISWIVFSIRLVRSRTFLTKAGKIKVYVSDRIVSPFVCGIIPKIYVTPEASKSEAFSNVILHEKVHVAHGDVIWNLLRICAVSVFWYNPVIWAAAILSKRDAEFACDETVALKLGDSSKLEYARMIVEMTPVKKNYAISFAGGPIKERVIKLTNKHKNKFIVAAVVVLIIGICCAATFIGMNYLEGNGDETTAETGKETEKEKETDSENDSALTKEAFEVYEATEENIAKYAPEKIDVSGSEYNFSLIIVPTRDVKSFKINRLIWNEELLVESEEVIEEVGDVKKGEAMLITTDSVEIIGYVGISYVDGENTARYYPATSGKDGSALLAEIGGNLLSADMLYPGVKQYEVTVSDELTFSDTLYALVREEDEKTYGQFLKEESKLVIVKGLSVPVYLEFGDSWYLKSVAAYGHISKAEVDSAPLYYMLADYEETVIFTYHNYKKDDTWVFTPGEAKVFISDDVTATVFNVVDSSLEYTRYSVKFHHPTQCAKTAPLDIAVSRDEFFAETGKAKVENGKLVLSELNTQTIDEAFDLDAIYEEYKLNYLGYLSADDVIERNIKRNEGKELPYTEATIMPDESFIGNWNDGGGDDISISSISENEIKFHAGVFRLFGFYGTAVLDNGVWKFVEDYDNYDENKKIKGRLEFTESSVKVIYEDIGRFDYFGVPATHTMTRGRTSAGGNVTAYHGRIGRCGGYMGDGLLDSLLGYYTLTSVDTSVGWYSLTESVVVCNGGCECDYDSYNQHKPNGKPTAEYGVSDGWKYPVKIYYSLPDEEIKDIYKQQYIDQHRSAIYVFDIGDGMHLRVTLQRYDSYDTPIRDNERELIDEIAKNIDIEYKLRDAKTGEKIVFGSREANVLPEHIELAKTDPRYKWITSFISKDIEGCAAVLRSNMPIKDEQQYVASMAPLETITFGRYSVSEIDDEDEENFDSMQFEFTIIESGYDVYPPGYYKAVVSTGYFFNFSLEFTERPSFDGVDKISASAYEKITDMLEPVEDLFHGAYNVNYPDDPYSDTIGWKLMTTHAIKTYLEAKDGKYPQTFAPNTFTPEYVASWIYYYPGESYVFNDDVYTVKDGEYSLNGSGGFSASYDIIGFVGDIENIVMGGAYEFSVDVLYYADIAEFGNAFTVRFTFEAVASVYGLKLCRIEKISDNGFKNWTFKH